MTAELISCWNCSAGISPTDNYCRYCGKGQGEFTPWHFKIWGIIFLTVAALGPFSLYFLWKSPAISKQSKIICAILILAFTWYIAISGMGVYNSLKSFLSPEDITAQVDRM